MILGEAQNKKALHEDLPLRIRNVAGVFVLAFLLLAARLWHLQIVNWAEYKNRADNQRLHLQRLEAPRGRIHGADGAVLADNRVSHDLVFIPAECDEDEWPEVCRRLGELIGLSPDRQAALLDKIKAGAREPYNQIVVTRDVSWNKLTRVEEYMWALPGVQTVVRHQRRYAYGEVAGQLLGYLGEIGPDELERRPEYSMGDLIGQAGLERVYEDTLRGTDGHLLVNRYASGVPQLRTDAYGNPTIQFDSFGRPIKEEKDFRLPPVAGEPIHVTIDVGLQDLAERLLKGEQGAIAILNADTGAVLALSSAPGYDPNIFVTTGFNNERLAALSDPVRPMRNRCYQEALAPGSIFKILVAMAALEERVVSEHSTHYCPGVFSLGNHSKRCWRRGGHGNISVEDSLAFSCDVYYYNVGLELGVDRIHEWARRFGFGGPSGLDLSGEVPGVVPSKAWKVENFPGGEPWRRQWYPAETCDLAIGQGYLTITPLQGAVMMASVVNGGRVVKPFLNADAVAPDVSEPLVSERTLQLVRAGLQKCVEKQTAPSGTGRLARVPGITVLGKTGTAQRVGREHYAHYENELDIPYALRDHAWFVAGVLDREPRLAMCILVEHGLHGSTGAAPLAKEIIDYYYGREGYSDTPQEIFTLRTEDRE